MKKKKEEESGLQSMDTKYAVVRRVIANIRGQLERVEALLADEGSTEEVERLSSLGQQETDELLRPLLQERVIDGVFDGERMIGEDGSAYPVPVNYASKSKLVEGDLLRLTISCRGRFLYKQKGPIERQRIVGTLIQDENTQDWIVVAQGQKYRVLPSAISYFHGSPNDQVVVFTPKHAPSKWAAVENIIKGES